MTQEVPRKAPVVGFVRYSQKITFSGKEKDVFESEYFEYRFQIFKDVTLKSFQGQTDQEFVLLILHSDTMPIPYKEKFLKLEKENIFLYNLFVADNLESFNETIKKSINYVAFDNDIAITFRIDNDDAVQHDFIQKLGDFVKIDFVGFTVNMPNVFIIKRISDKSYMIEERDYPSNSIGLAYVTTRRQYKTILEVAQHHLINNENTMILLAKNTAAGLMTINGENAANAINKSQAKVLDETALSENLSENKFDKFNLECLRVFKETQNSAELSRKNAVRLLIPPVFFMGIGKIKDFLKINKP